MSVNTLRDRPTAGTPRPWSFPAVERIELPNGMAALLCHMPHRAVTSVQLVVAAPREQEPEGLDGVAAVAAHALMQGTERLSAETFADELERRGATLDIHGTGAGLRAGLGVPVSRLEAALALLTEALTTPSFVETEVDRLLKLRLDAIDREDANPEALAGRALMATLYEPSARISRSGEGDRESVRRITRDAVAAYHAAHISSRAATVILAGDLSDGSARSALERTLGTWQTSASAPPPRSVPPAAPVGRTVVVHRPGSVQTALRVARVAGTRHEPTYPATALGNFALGGGMNGRLMQRLREEKGYTYGIYTHALTLATTGVLVIAGAVETGVTGDAVSEVFAVVGGIVREGVTAEERALAVDSLTSVPRRIETTHQITSMLAGALEEGLPDGFHAQHYAALERTTTAEISATVARDWRPEGLSLIAVGDADVIAGPLEALGRGPVTVVPAGESAEAGAATR